MTDTKEHKESFFARVAGKSRRIAEYLVNGVWSDPRRDWRINVLRVINLSVNSFLNRDIQTQACAMTYRSMLALVPALALFIGIGRGFNLQQTLQDELYRIFPAQKEAIAYSMRFVESYLDQTSGGVFIGVGIVFLLWTLISLLGNVEDTFNLIWGVKSGRSIWRKATDYTAMLLILPVLMICASGISLILSSTLEQVMQFKFLTPLVTVILEGTQWLMTFLFFTAAYMLIPNTKVKFGNAFISGTIAGISFLVLQWLFVTGTLYVTRYNAIYGSVAFIPLLLLWMQLAWMICLAGAIICYSSQNVFAFNLATEVGAISNRYRDMVTVAIAAIIARRFIDNEKPATARDIMNLYDIPARLVTDLTDRLVSAGICCRVLLSAEKDVFGYQLATDPSALTVKKLHDKLYSLGKNDFIIGFDRRFDKVDKLFSDLMKGFDSVAENVLVGDLITNDYSDTALTTVNKNHK